MQTLGGIDVHEKCGGPVENLGIWIHYADRHVCCVLICDAHFDYQLPSFPSLCSMKKKKKNKKSSEGGEELMLVTERMVNEKTKESLSRKKNTAFPRALATNGNQRPAHARRGKQTLV